MPSHSDFTDFTLERGLSVVLMEDLFYLFFSFSCHFRILLPNVMSCRKCLALYPRFVPGGDTHDRCVQCLRVNGLFDCRRCDSLKLKVLYSRLAFFLWKEGCSFSPRCSSSAVVKAPHELSAWGDNNECEPMEGEPTNFFLLLPFLPRSSAFGGEALYGLVIYSQMKMSQMKMACFPKRPWTLRSLWVSYATLSLQVNRILSC